MKFPSKAMNANGRQDTWIFAAAPVWALLALMIMCRGWLFGQLSPDSCGYLQLAQWMLDGHGLHLPALEEPSRLFAVWPAGYPALIFIVAKTTGMQVVMASKLLNVLLVGLDLYFLRRILGNAFRPWAPMLLFAPMVELSTYTWSEVPFITSMLWLAAELQALYRSERIATWRIVALTAAAIAMFLFRYIGAISVVILGGAAAIALRQREMARFRSLSLATLFVGIVIGLYLFRNHVEVGYATGMPRIPAPEPIGLLAWMTLKAYMRQAILLIGDTDIDTAFGAAWAWVCVAALSASLIYVFRLNQRVDAVEIHERSVARWLVPLAIGALYLTAITVLRWRTQFDRLSTRLLFPGTLLILAGAGVLLEGCRPLALARLRRVAWPLAAISVVGLLMTDVQRWQSAPTLTPWTKVEAAVLAEAAVIPKGSIVLFGPESLSYLRPDLVRLRPRAYPLFTDRQPWGDMLDNVQRHARGRAIFTYVEDDLDASRYHLSVISAMSAWRGQRLVRLMH